MFFKLIILWPLKNICIDNAVFLTAFLSISLLFHLICFNLNQCRNQCFRCSKTLEYGTNTKHYKNPHVILWPSSMQNWQNWHTVHDQTTIIVNCSVLRKSPKIRSTATLGPLEILYVLEWNLAVLKKKTEKNCLIFDTVSIFFLYRFKNSH